MDGYRRTLVVIEGSFNPAIFHPGWFETHDLLPKLEVERATARGTQTVVTGEWTSIQFASCTLEVQQERWALSTARADWAADLGPLARSIFALLPHTPLREVAFAVEQHRKVGTVPLAALLDHWLPLAGLAALVDGPVRRGGNAYGRWRERYETSLTLEPSVRMTNGLFVRQQFKRSLSSGAEGLLQALEEDWAPALDRVEEICNILLAGAPS